MILFPLAILEMPEGDDRDYMEWLYIKYQRLMFSVAWKESREKAEVEDIVSDSVVRLIKNVKTLRGLNRKQLTVYISKTVRTTAIHKKMTSQRYEIMEIEDWMFSDDIKSTVEKKIELKDELRYVLSEIYKLPEKEQKVLRLKWSTEMTDEEIARAVGLSVKSISKYISRGRAHLRKELYKEDDE